MVDGLDTVIAAETILSDVDGARGRLVIRGRSMDDLAQTSKFEGVAHLLWNGFFEDLPRDLTDALGKARTEVFSEIACLDTGLLDRTPIEAMRALTARLADGDGLDVALRLVAAPAVFTGAVVRSQQGLAPIAPDPSLRHAADILRMVNGTSPSDSQASALDTYLVTIADHGLNASTFAARVIASTRAGLTSAVLGGLGALKGLHGGAPGPVIEILDEIGSPERAQAWLETALDGGDRLMGFGHRVYRVRDPRADALKIAVRRLGRESAGSTGRLVFAEAVEAAALSVLKTRKPDRTLETNVEFYTALLLEALRFPPEAFTCVFAMGRVAGRIAHAREQLAGGRIVRPQSRYVGPEPMLAA